ncbi:MAG: hypothetical protein J5809_00245 [Selenomonadaceae bacterium]|nr:hypothetical protein [Selenomonadaceae bacterium]
MRSFFMGLGISLMLTGILGMWYIWHHDHREAATLEEYAKLELAVARDEFGGLEGANLSLWDLRYGEAKLLNKAVIFTDSVPLELEAATKQTQTGWQYENKLFVSLPKSALEKILAAKEVRIKFFYDNGQATDLPLGPKELVLWQRKLRW